MDNSNSKIQSWLNGSFDEKSKQQILELQKTNPKALEDAFSEDLHFGTGGMRGLMGPGTNRMNDYTVCKATCGLSKYFKKLYPGKPLKAVIGYDTRHNSLEFAKKAAAVLAHDGIHVILTQTIRPTPFVSYLVRKSKADFGIMITASHNPKEYNGYKVYGSDGAQLVAPHDHAIELLIAKLSFDVIPKDLNTDSRLISYSTNEDDQTYLKAVYQCAVHPKQSKDFGSTLSILYTNLHGTGLTLVPQALKQLGFTDLSLVKEQTTFDGDFPYAPKPNPEDPKTLELGIKQMKEKNIDLFLATDPDADRLAAVIMHQGEPYTLSGNEMATLALYHLLFILEQKHQIKHDLTVVSTIVSSRMLKRIAEDYEVTYIDVLTGFKFIGEVIRKQDNHEIPGRFLFGAEESYGFLYGTYARDKDGIAASCLIAEMALYYKLKGKTLLDVLYELYRLYGITREAQTTVMLPEGEAGNLAREKVMQKLRSKDLTHLDGVEITAVEDYLSHEKTERYNGHKTPLDLPTSDVLVFHLEDDTSLIIRPSGTEPKIKIYGNYYIKSYLRGTVAKNECDEKVKGRLENVKKQLLSYL
jgi:phosphoglucomutase/phosphomannomutase